MTPTNWCELLGRQAELLSKLLEIGDRSQAAIAADRMSELLGLLGQKQTYLDELMLVRRQLGTHRQLAASKAFCPDDVWQIRSRQALADAEAAFTKLLELEKICEEQLTASRDRLRARLQNVDSGRAAAFAYDRQALVPPAASDFSGVG